MNYFRILYGFFFVSFQFIILVTLLAVITFLIFFVSIFRPILHSFLIKRSLLIDLISVNCNSLASLISSSPFSSLYSQFLPSLLISFPIASLIQSHLLFSSLLSWAISDFLDMSSKNKGSVSVSTVALG